MQLEKISTKNKSYKHAECTVVVEISAQVVFPEFCDIHIKILLFSTPFAT